MVLYVYIGTILISFGIYELSNWAVHKDIKDEGYIWIRERNIYRRVLIRIENVVKTFLAVFIPIFNLLISLSFLFFYDSIKRKFIQNMLSEGRIKKINEVYIRRCQNVGSEE